MEIISIDNYLDTFDNSNWVFDYSPHDAFEAFKEIEAGVSPYLLANSVDVSESTLRSWSNNRIPFYIKQIKCLESKKLLPLLSDAVLIDYVKELYLHSLFSGSLTNASPNKNSTNISYQWILNNDADKLAVTQNVISDVFDVQFGDNNLKRSRNALYMQQKNGRAYPMLQGLSRLLISSGLPVGDKYDQLINIPSFVDQNSFVYFAFKLKGFINDDIALFRLWSSSEDIADQNVNLILDFLDGHPFDFKGRTDFNYVDGYESYRPNINVKKDKIPFLNLFLSSYTSLLGV